MIPKAVLLDCDGVIVDSEGIAFSLLEQDLADAGLPLARQEMEARFLGGTIRGLYAAVVAEGARLPATWVEDFYERLYAKLAESTPLVPGIEGVLRRLDQLGIPYAVGSNGTSRKMQITLSQHPDIWQRLQGRVFSGQELGFPKPAPDLWLHCAAFLGVRPGDAVVVDDSPNGALGAKRAGIRCLGLAQHGDGAALRAVGAEVFHRLDDLPGLLGI